MNFGYCAETSNAVPYNYDELSAQIKVTSPIENITYSGPDVVVNADAYIGGHEQEIGSRYIPYQNISCVYSLDGSEWQNMSLVSFSNLNTFSSLVNSFWYTTMWLNYTVVLHNAPEGLHYLTFNVTPNATYSRSYSGPEKTSVHFEVQSSEPSPVQSPLNELNDILIIGLVIAVVICVGSVIYVKKALSTESLTKYCRGFSESKE